MCVAKAHSWLEWPPTHLPLVHDAAVGVHSHKLASHRHAPSLGGVPQPEALLAAQQDVAARMHVFQSYGGLEALSWKQPSITSLSTATACRIQLVQRTLIEASWMGAMAPLTGCHGSHGAGQKRSRPCSHTGSRAGLRGRGAWFDLHEGRPHPVDAGRTAANDGAQPPPTHPPTAPRPSTD